MHASRISVFYGLLPDIPYTAYSILFCVYTVQGAVQTVSERLSQHVLSNYSKFVTGVTEVASVEQDLQVP